MSGSIRILTGPPGPGLTVRLLAEYLNRCREIGTVLWLAPTERAATETLRRIAAAGRPVLAPNVFTPAGFANVVLARSVPDWNPIAPSARRLLVEDALEDVLRKKGMAYFRRVAESRGLRDAAEGMLDELEAAGIDLADFASAVRGPRATKLSGCAEIATAIADRLGAAFAPIGSAAQIVANGLLAPFHRVRTVFVDGAITLAPASMSLIATLARRAEVWLTVPDAGVDRAEITPITAAVRSQFSAALVEPNSAPPADRPAGLRHLEEHLFGAPTAPAADATGLDRIEAPGVVGEARLVARRIRTLLAAGARADRIVVTTRTLGQSADTMAEVFDQYGLPVDLDVRERLTDRPAVATLLRALRLADEGWPFAGVSSLLRSSYFRPAWPEGAPETVQRAEGLLRQLGEFRDRAAYLKAVRVWAETPPERLEDEGPEEPRRKRRAELAAECRPFLERFFAAWDGFPAEGTPRAFADSVRQFARDIGLETAATADDRAALHSLWGILEGWTSAEIARAELLRRLATACASEPVPAVVGPAGRIRIVSGDEARHLECDFLFIVGLGERSFPRLAGPASLLDDADRARLRESGLPYSDPAGRLGAEQLLFLDLVNRPRRELILSYAAVDEKGQPLLPGSFLRSVTECFTAEALNPEHQKMLIEGYFEREPRSVAEARVQFAVALRGQTDPARWRHPDLPAELCEHLRWANEVAAARFRSNDYGRYDGQLDSPSALAEVRARFGPEHIFSPTALETYVACPFRFLLQYVLNLEELEEPGDEVEQTRRGAAYHRALARLHRKLREADPEMTRSRLPDRVGPELLAEIDLAVREYAARAPSPASKILWELEGRRLHRSAQRYRDHWDGYLEPWRKAKTDLTPHLLEADFGVPPDGAAESKPPLVIEVDGVTVRIGGRIDRVDVAQLEDGLGFWVIDYKTGRSQYYTSTSLTRMEKLQLSLYALAVEKVFFPGQNARPLGLAYWMVTDTGPKGVLPRQAMAWLADPDGWAKFRSQLEAWVGKLVRTLRDGRFPLAPRSDDCTATCPFGQVCRISQSRDIGKVWELTPEPETARGA